MTSGLFTLREAVMNDQNNCGQAVSVAVYGALAARDIRCAKAFNQIYVEPTDTSIKGQIAAANCFWRYQLGMVDGPTISARECLTNDIELQDWIRLFSTEVVPVVVEYQLPRVFSHGHP